MSVTPPVLWSQKDKSIKLVVDIVAVEKDSLVLTVTENSIHFECTGQKTIDQTVKYEFDLEFHKTVDPERYLKSVKDRSVKIVIAKSDADQGEWSKICTAKHRWLKFDVDSVEVTDDETIAARKLDQSRKDLEAKHGPLPNDAKIQQISSMLNVDEISRDLDLAEKELYDMFRNSYLTIYNSVVGLGFLYVFMISVIRVVIDGPGAMVSNYRSMGWLLKSCQNTVYLELLHSFFKLTKTPLSATVMQVLGRNVVLFLVLDAEPSLQSSYVVYALMICWSAIEVIRYPYYTLQIYDIEFPALTWLRYSLWIPLYPVGICCEAYLVYQTIPLVQDSKRLTVELPNNANFAFSFYYYLILHLAAIVIGGAYLMHHMVRQRASAMKKLSRNAALLQVQKNHEEYLEIRKKKEMEATKKK